MNHHPLMPVYRGLLAILLFVSAQAFAADGVIRSASGDIFVNGNPASQGDEVSSGDTLKTAFGAWMIVEMDDQSVLDVRSNTEVLVQTYAYNPADPSVNAQIVDVLDGTLRYTSGLIGANDYDDVMVAAGNVALGIRGTAFQIVYNRRTGKLDVRVTEGKVKLELITRTQVGGLLMMLGRSNSESRKPLADLDADGNNAASIPNANTEDSDSGLASTTTVIEVTITDKDGNETVVQIDTSDRSDYGGVISTSNTDLRVISGDTTFNQAIINTDE